MDPILLIDESDNAGGSFKNTFARLRAEQQELGRHESESARVALASQMEELCRAFAKTLRISGLIAAARCAEALNTLLRDICERPRNLTAETLRTLAQTLDFLDGLCQAGKSANPCDPGTGSVLVVDDEPISRRALCGAMDKVGLKSTAVHQADVALALLRENNFDLVILDVSMPDMSGFELCAQMRELPGHQQTPVVFVTSLNNLENRAASLKTGGCDLIVKPFRHAEFGARALLHIMRARRPAAC